MNQSNGESININEVKDSGEIFSILCDFKDYFTSEHMKTEDSRREYSKKLAEYSSFLTASVDGKIIGFLVSYLNDKKGGYVYTSLLSVKPDSGMLGPVALIKLADYLLDAAKEKKLYKFRFETRKDNRKSQSLVRTLGFKYVCDASPDTIYMEADIADILVRIAKFDSRFRNV